MSRRILLLSAFILLAPAVAGQGMGDFFNGSVELSDFENLVKVEQGDRSDFNSTNGTVKFFDRDEGLNMPVSYIMLILAFLLIVVYAVDIDPFWIAILLFLLVFTATVYYLDLPKYTIPAVAVLVLLVKHFR